MKGNEPHTYLSIVTADGMEYEIVGKLKNKIAAEYQGNTIKIKGEVVEEALAPGFPPPFEVIEIIEPGESN